MNIFAQKDKISSIQFFEELPNSCPPPRATPADNMEVYRVVHHTPAKSSDFFSQRKNKPFKPFNVDECVAMSVSVFDNLDDAVNLKKIPAFKNGKIAKVILERSDGVVLKTGANKGHYSWWRSQLFDPQKAVLL
ncbi:MAG: hypothetical protein Q4A64_07030 [Porphyromonadaceae bacterium]|nr:hypothetical protein [Porphyromonadaceae bacterium]